MDGVWGIEDFELDHLFFLEAVEDYGETRMGGTNTPRLSDQEVADLFPPNPATRTDPAHHHNFPYTPQFSPGFFSDSLPSGAVTPSTQAIVNSIAAESPRHKYELDTQGSSFEQQAKPKRARQSVKHENTTASHQDTTFADSNTTASKKTARKDNKSVTAPTTKKAAADFRAKGPPPESKQTTQVKSGETLKATPDKCKRGTSSKHDSLSDNSDGSDSDDSEQITDEASKGALGNGAPTGPGKKRRVHNKQAADRYRKKKKQQFEFFKEEVERLTSECDEWRRQCDELKRELLFLKETVKPAAVPFSMKKSLTSKAQLSIPDIAPSPSNAFLPPSPMLTLAQVAALTQDSKDRLTQQPLKPESFAAPSTLSSGTFSAPFSIQQIHSVPSSSGHVLPTNARSFAGQFPSSWNYPMLDMHALAPQLLPTPFGQHSTLPAPSFSLKPV